MELVCEIYEFLNIALDFSKSDTRCADVAASETSDVGSTSRFGLRHVAPHYAQCPNSERAAFANPCSV